MRRSIFISIFFLQRQVQQQQQQQVMQEDLQQQVEILKGNSFTLPEFAFSKFDIKGHIKQIQIEHITKSQIMQEMAQFIKHFYFFSGGGIFLTIRCWGCRPTFQILTKDPISDQYLSLPLENTGEIMIM